MNCSEVANRLDEFLEHRLGGAEEAAVTGHLETCQACRAEVDAARKLRVLTADLPRSLQPPRDLWPGIRAGIENGTVVRARFARRALVAAAVAVVLVGSVVTAYLVGRQQATPMDDLWTMAGPGPSSAALASFEGLGVEDYSTTRAMLLDALHARQRELSPETLEVVMVNLRVIDEAIERIGEALGESPGDARLMRQLAAAYRQQIDLLRQAARLPAEV